MNILLEKNLNSKIFNYGIIYFYRNLNKEINKINIKVKIEKNKPILYNNKKQNYLPILYNNNLNNNKLQKKINSIIFEIYVLNELDIINEKIEFLINNCVYKSHMIDFMNKYIN